jgi:hypothetical protein
MIINKFYFKKGDYKIYVQILNDTQFEPQRSFR